MPVRSVDTTLSAKLLSRLAFRLHQKLLPRLAFRLHLSRMTVVHPALFMSTPAVYMQIWVKITHERFQKKQHNRTYPRLVIGSTSWKMETNRSAVAWCSQTTHSVRCCFATMHDTHRVMHDTHRSVQLRWLGRAAAHFCKTSSESDA